MRRRRLLGRLTAAALAVLALGAAAGFFWLRTSLPRYDGTIPLPGLESPVAVLRDARAVPHIFARSTEDAYFGLGFVHAQDRLWQMEFRRRLGAGRLAEVLGPRLVHTDRFMRALGLDRAAAKSLAFLDEVSLKALTAYAAGVNAYLATRRGALPPEFVLLRAPAPEPWTPSDSIVVLKHMAWALAGNARDELLRAELAGRLTEGQIGALWPSYPGDGPVALPDLAALEERPRLGRLLAFGPGAGEVAGKGSNAWVVAGRRSETGKPFLANDPHLDLAAPSPWYFAHLEAPGFKVVGGTLAGVPVVVLGHNGRIAWGLTTTYADVQDLFIERVHPEDPGRYLAPGGSRPFAVREETIRVKGGEEVVIRVRETRHGPVVVGTVAPAGKAKHQGEVLALAWTTLAEDDLSFQAAVKLNRARDWETFVTAARDFGGPPQTIVYADVEGNIGFYAAGRVPTRRRGDGSVPVPGWTGAYDWEGSIPFQGLPHGLNPESGVIVTANNKIVPDSYPYFLTRDWPPPYRARRIGALVAGLARHGLESFRRIQGDVTSLMAREMVPYLLAAEPRTPLAAAARDLLAGWDGAMGADRPEPLVFAAWYRELTRLVYADELGPSFPRAWSFRPLFMKAVLAGDQGAWCDDVTTAQPESCESLAAEALDRAVAFLAERYGGDPQGWRWGEAHPAHHAHRGIGGWPLIGRVFDIVLPGGGDPFTVNAGGYRLGDAERPFVVGHGPSMRALYDLADLERSLFVHGTGQSGNALSRHYRDFAEAWRDNRPFRIPTRREEVEAQALGRLALVPAP
ncbi:MAG: penicillin acylase family protein [Alphaproteobacteria bacterium]